MSRFLVRAVAVATVTTLGRPGRGQHGVRVQLRLRQQRHVLGHPGRRAAAGRHGSIRATQVGAGPEPRLQHDDQRLRRDQGAGCHDARAAVQRRADARLRPDVRRRRPLHDDAGGDARRRRDHARRSASRRTSPVGQASWARWLDTFTQHDGRADHDQGRVRRPDGLQRVGRELERDGQHAPAATRRSPRPTRGPRSRRRCRARRSSAARRRR